MQLFKVASQLGLVKVFTLGPVYLSGWFLQQFVGYLYKAGLIAV